MEARRIEHTSTELEVRKIEHTTVDPVDLEVILQSVESKYVAAII